MTYDSIIHYCSIYAGSARSAWWVFEKFGWDKIIIEKINENIKLIIVRVSNRLGKFGKGARH